ncbi:unnamed protein product [Closterium sp. NIES-53]
MAIEHNPDLVMTEEQIPVGDDMLGELGDEFLEDLPDGALPDLHNGAAISAPADAQSTPTGEPAAKKLCSEGQPSAAGASGVASASHSAPPPIPRASSSGSSAATGPTPVRAPAPSAPRPAPVSRSLPAPPEPEPEHVAAGLATSLALNIRYRNLRRHRTTVGTVLQAMTRNTQSLVDIIFPESSAEEVRAAVLARRPRLRAAAALGASESAAALGARESANALGASASTATGPTSAKALHTFTLDSGASRCLFRDCTTVTPLATPVPVSLADPTGGPVAARASTVLPCPAVPSGSLSGPHLPAFLTNLLSNAVLQDEWVDTFIRGGQRVAICKCSRTGRHLAMSGGCVELGVCVWSACSVLLVLGTLSPNSPLTPPPRCLRLVRLPCERSMHYRLLVSGLPRSLPSLPRSPAPPCLLCVEGRQRAAPHSFEFPPTTAPLKTLHMDVWGLAPVGGTDQERYFLLVVDDYTCYTTVFPLRRKAVVSGVLIPWIRATRRQLRERFRRDLPVLRLHSDTGDEFSSGLLEEFCRDEGIRQTFTLLASPQQNGIAERRIGLIMEVAQTSPTIRWTGKVGDASMFWVWGALSLVRDAKASKLSSRTLRCIFLGFPTDASPWQFYHPCSRRVFSSQDVTFDEFVRFYGLHLHASHPVPLEPLILVPFAAPVDPVPPQVLAPSRFSQVDPPPVRIVGAIARG